MITPPHQGKPDPAVLESWQRLGKLARAGIIAGECKSGNTYEALRRARLVKDGSTFKGKDGRRWFRFTRTPLGELVAAWGSTVKPRTPRQRTDADAP